MIQKCYDSFCSCFSNQPSLVKVRVIGLGIFSMIFKKNKQVKKSFQKKTYKKLLYTQVVASPPVLVVFPFHSALNHSSFLFLVHKKSTNSNDPPNPILKN